MIERILTWLGALVVLGACSSMLVTPVSGTLWLVLGITFMTRPALRSVWRGCTVLHSIPFLFLSMLGFLTWYSASSRYYDQRNVDTSLHMFLGGIFLTIATCGLWYVSARKRESNFPVGCYVPIQIAIASAALLYILWLLVSAT